MVLVVYCLNSIGYIIGLCADTEKLGIDKRIDKELNPLAELTMASTLIKSYQFPPQS